MNILNILKCSIELLTLTETEQKLNNITDDNEDEILQDETIKRLYNLTKLSIQELCSNYISVYTEAEADSINKIIPMNSFANIIKVQKVIREVEPVNYKIINRNIVLESDGKYLVRYSCYPQINSVFDEVDFISNSSPDVLIFGVCAYYCLTMGRFEDFNYFQSKYTDKAKSLKELKIFDMPQRRWK